MGAKDENERERFRSGKCDSQLIYSNLKRCIKALVATTYVLTTARKEEVYFSSFLGSSDSNYANLVK